MYLYLQLLLPGMPSQLTSLSHVGNYFLRFSCSIASSEVLHWPPSFLVLQSALCVSLSNCLLCCICLCFPSNWPVGSLKSHPCILYPSKVPWMEKEYTCWIYLIIFWGPSYAQGRHCTKYCDEFCRFSFLLEGNFSISFLDSVPCHPLMSNLCLLFLGSHPIHFLSFNCWQLPNLFSQ